MLEVDGSDGGGQLVRTALALGAVTGRSVRIEGIRGARSEPGLRHQHLAAVRALERITNARTRGATLGSERVTFEPGDPTGGTYAVDVGTAGSATLVADAVLPLATAIDEPLAVTVCGGTDVAWSPPIDAHRLAKFPLLRAHGWGVALECDRRGFYPEGGGRVTLRSVPSTPDPLALERRGDPERVTVHSVASADLTDADVARRQAEAAAGALESAGYEPQTRLCETATVPSTGSAVVVCVDCTVGTVAAAELGELGTPAERVGRAAGETAVGAVASSGAVDEHLADQLLLPLVLAGGTLCVPSLTDHVETSVDLLRTFGYDVTVEPGDGDSYVVSV